MTMNREFQLSKAAKICGLSAFTVDYLARSKIVTPSIRSSAGRGKKRLYAFGDLVALKTAASLLASGIEASKLKSSLALLQKKYGKELTTAPANFFCTDGKRVYFRTGEHLYADLTNGGQFVFQFVVDLEALNNQVKKKVKSISAAAEQKRKRSA